MRRLLITFCAALLCALPLAASAQRAYTLGGADIYAGPGGEYPVVARLAPGVGVQVQGCLGDYSWCDVTFGGNRGWIYAGELSYPYRSGRVPILEYGPQLSLPIITFSLGNYWDRHYRARPWYRERNDWEHRHWNRGNDWRNERHDWRDERRDHWRGRGNDGRNEWRDRRDDRNDRREYREQRGNDHRGRNETRGNLQNDGRGGYTVQRGYNNDTQPGSAPNFDNGAGHQQ
jgi:uncharacterized protein YraI